MSPVTSGAFQKLSHGWDQVAQPSEDHRFGEFSNEQNLSDVQLPLGFKPCLESLEPSPCSGEPSGHPALSPSVLDVGVPGTGFSSPDT